MKRSIHFLSAIVLVSILSCSKAENNNSIVDDQITEDYIITKGCEARSHICDADLSVQRDSVCLTLTMEDAIERGISESEYNLVLESLSRLNSPNTRLHELDSHMFSYPFSGSVFAQGIIIFDSTQQSGGTNPRSTNLYLPNTFNVRNAIGFDFSFSSTSSSPSLHTVMVHDGTGQVIYNNDIFEYNTVHIEKVVQTWPVYVEYYYPGGYFSSGVCTWKAYGYNNLLLE